MLWHRSKISWRQLLTELSLVSFLTVFTAGTVEYLKPGLVSNFFDLNWLLIVSLLVFVAAVIWGQRISWNLWLLIYLIIWLALLLAVSLRIVIRLTNFFPNFFAAEYLVILVVIILIMIINYYQNKSHD